MDIDLVYLWVDGSDPRWAAKRNTLRGNVAENTEAHCKGRSVNNNELKYSLRSAEKYAPWIRKIFIVTDNQQPDWLDTTNTKIQIIDIKDILPAEALPCFNSNVIEYFLYKIPDLSEHFLYANDDMFFGASLQPDFFFKNDGYPIIRLKRKLLRSWHFYVKRLFKRISKKKIGFYEQIVHDTAIFIKKKFGKYYSAVPHHNIDAYRKSDCCEVMTNICRQQVEKTLHNHFRTVEDLQRSIISYYALAVGHGHLKYIGRKEAMRFPIQKLNFEKYQRYLPKLFCVNDSHRVSDDDREKVVPFLEKLFPEKSPFEK